MMRWMRLSVPTAFAALALLGCSLPAQGSPGTDAYSDPAGDVADPKIVPDISEVTLVTGDDGTVSFDVHLATSNDLHSAPADRGLSTIFVLLDTDRNPATGGDYGDFAAYQIGPSRFNFRRWEGSAYADFPHQPMRQQFTGTDLTFTVTLADIGVTEFDFSIRGGNLGDADNAPNTGTYSYPPSITKLVVPAGLLRPKAGRVFRLSGVTARLSNDVTATPDSLGCTLAYRGKALRPLAGGCAWKVAKQLRKKRLTLLLTAGYRGGSATATFIVRPR